MLRSSADYSAVDHFKIGLPALIPTFWELVPYSWIVDYFTTVGDFLEDTFIATPANSVYLLENRKYRASGLNYMQHTVSGGYEILSERKGTANWSYYEFERKVLSTLPHRILRLKTIDEVGKHSLTKLLNLTSLFGAKLQVRR